MSSTAAPTAEQLALIKGMAQSMSTATRTPLLEDPADYGMEFEDVFFPSADGVPLEAWFIPAPSNRLIVCNHPMTMNRYGYPGHLEPWSQFNDVQVNFLKVYKALYEAGYNVLTYDLRNHGRSGDANGGLTGTGLLEWRDVVGAALYVKQHDQLKNMSVGLFNPCAGGNAAMVAWTKRPELFADIKAFVCAQPCSMSCSVPQLAGLQGIGEFMDILNEEQAKAGGFPFAEMSPHPYAPQVTAPTFIVQVRDDSWTKPEDVQTTFDLLPEVEKKLHWIEGTNKRFDGYNYFGENPASMIEFFNKHMC